MGLIKRVYKDKETIITADNLNDIQDAVIALEDGLFSVDNDKSGEVITITDAANRGFRSLSIFGRTTQDGTPTPDAPVDLVSVGDSGSITVTVNGENEGQSMTIATPNGLPGIPVADGGNYTDENGQQWICDELDFARGVYIKRIDTRVFDGSSDEYWTEYGIEANRSFHIASTKFALGLKMSLCDRFENVPTAWGSSFATTYGIYSDHSTSRAKYFRAPNNVAITLEQWRAWLAENPVTLVYVMETPEETPLSAEEIATYAALRTCKDNTTVSNDASAYMELEYVMDAKKYIESILSGGGGSSSARLGSVTLKSSAWKTSADGLHSQVVTIAGITPYSKVDLLPSVEQLAIFHNKDVAFVTENEDGVVTVYAIGDKPTMDYTMQISITEVTV